jgi:hypothetical protein
MSGATGPWSGTPRRAPGGWRTLIWVVLLPVVVLVQVGLIAFLPVPWAVPDLAVVIVLGLAHHRGALTGGLVGVWAGLLLDLLPPALGPFGAWAVVLGVVGGLHGQVITTRRPGPLLALGLLALSAAGATAAHALLLWFAGLPVTGDAIVRAALGAGAWALVLAPVALVLTGGRIGADDPRDQLQREPTLLDAVTPGWVGMAGASGGSSATGGDQARQQVRGATP